VEYGAAGDPARASDDQATGPLVRRSTASAATRRLACARLQSAAAPRSAGTTTVACGRRCARQRRRGSTLVTVRDTPPRVTVPASVTIEATAPAPGAPMSRRVGVGAIDAR
jgi:hypothetical protein